MIRILYWNFINLYLQFVYIYTFFFFEFNEIPQSVLNIYTTIFESPKSLDTLFFLLYIVTKLWIAIKNYKPWDESNQSHG